MNPKQLKKIKKNGPANTKRPRPVNPLTTLPQ